MSLYCKINVKLISRFYFCFNFGFFFTRLIIISTGRLNDNHIIVEIEKKNCEQCRINNEL